MQSLYCIISESRLRDPNCTVIGIRFLNLDFHGFGSGTRNFLTNLDLSLQLCSMRVLESDGSSERVAYVRVKQVFLEEVRRKK